MSVDEKEMYDEYEGTNFLFNFSFILDTATEEKATSLYLYKQNNEQHYYLTHCQHLFHPYELLCLGSINHTNFINLGMKQSFFRNDL